ncbi:MAG TPA: NAD(P)-dependent oxidoreductase, partial [Pirellulaceae bacterium]
MRIFVTGSAGFIAWHLVRQLIARGHVVTGLDHRSGGFEGPTMTALTGNLLEAGTWTPALRGIDAVVHLAAVHADQGHAPHEYWDTNLQGTRNLLDAMQQHAVKKLIFTSSMAVYGDGYETAMDEHTPPRPGTPYGQSKLAAEQAIREWCEQEDDRRAVLIRPCVVYGERNVANMYNLIRQIDSGWFLRFGAGNNVKSIAYVGNLVAAILHFLQEFPEGVSLVNYSDQPDLTVRRTVAIIRDQLGKRASDIGLPLWLGVAAAAPIGLLARLLGRPSAITPYRVRKLAKSTRMNSDAIRAL